MLLNLANKRKFVNLEDESIGSKVNCPKEFQFIKKLFSKVDFEFVKNNSRNFIDLVDANEDDDREKDDDDDDDEEDEYDDIQEKQREIDRKKFNDKLIELLNEQIENNLIEKYKIIVNQHIGKDKTKRYYVYSITLIDRTGKITVQNVKYIGKGTMERCLAHLRVAFLCIKFKINATTEKTKYFIDKLNENEKFSIDRTELCEEVDCLVRETLLIQLKNPDLLNVKKSSFDLEKIKLTDETILNEVNKSTVQQLFSNNNRNNRIDLNWLKNDYDQNFKSNEYILKRATNESDLSRLNYLISTGNWTISSQLTNEHKFIILAQILIFLDKEEALSDKGIEILFEFYRLNKPTEISIIRYCFLKLVKELLFADNYLVKLYEILNDLKSKINWDIENVLSSIVNKTRELLNDNPKMKRRIIRTYLPEQLYTMTKIIEFSKQNGVFLNSDCNWQIYNSIPNIETTVKHPKSSFVGLFQKIKRLGRYHNFDNLNDSNRKIIRKLVEQNYLKLKDNPKNHQLDFSKVSIDQKFVLIQLSKLIGLEKLPGKTLHNIYEECKPEGKPMNIQDIENWIRRFENELLSRTTDEEFKSIEFERKKEIIKIIKREFELVKDQKRQVHSRYEESTKYVILSLHGKITPIQILNTLVENKINGNIDSNLKLHTWFGSYKHIELPIIEDNLIKSKLDQIVQTAIKKYANRNHVSDVHSPGNRYFMQKLYSCNVKPSNIYKALCENQASLSGKIIGTVDALHSWLGRNKNKAQPEVDANEKANLNKLIKSVVEKYNGQLTDDLKK